MNARQVLEQNNKERIADLIDKGLVLEARGRSEGIVRMIAKIVARAFVTVLVLVLLVGGIGSAIYFPMKARSNDYGHTDPGSVGAGAYAAMQRWYGENDMPVDAILVHKTHDQIDGHEAWLTEWEASTVRGKIRHVCVYVWGRNNVDTPHGTYARVVSCQRGGGLGG